MRWRKQAVWLLPLLCVACGRGSSSSKPSPSASASAKASAAASVAASARPAPAPPPVCRIIRLTGQAKLGEVALASGAVLDGEAWVTLDEGGSMALKHTASGRELTINGPALFRACRRGREQLLLVRGTVLAASGMGSRPGAEVLIATPIAGVHYGDAEYTLTLDAKKLELEVRAGQVEVEPEPPKPGKPEKTTVSSKGKLKLPLGKPDPKALMAACQAAAEAAEVSARRVGDRSAPEPLGERAQAHVKARKAARSACTVAAAATGLVAEPEASASLWAEGIRWEGLWETIPRRRAQGAEK